MSLFKKDEDGIGIDQPVSKSTDKEAISSIIDQGMTIVGDITFKGKARIDGKIEGNIKGEYLILSETATIEGDIISGTVICQGDVKGNIKAEKFYAKKPTKVNGRLETTDLTVESGASLNGEIHSCEQKLSVVAGPQKAKVESSKVVAST